MTVLLIRLRAALSLCACAALIACGGGGGGGSDGPNTESAALGEHTLSWPPASNTEDGFMTLTVAGTGQAQSYAWEFGDGATATTLTGSTQHRYKRGEYTVRVTVTGSRGDTRSVTRTLSVLPGKPTVSIESTAPRDLALMPGAVIRFAAGLGNSPFDDMDLGPHDTYTYAWDFGDGATSDRPAATHAYAQAGRYTISLKVRDRQGREFPATSSVDISPVNAYPLLTTLGGWNAVDGGPNAQLPSSMSLARLPDGTLVLAGQSEKTVRTLSTNGVVGTLAGAPDIGGLRDGRGGEARFGGIQEIAAGSGGTVFVRDAFALRSIGTDGEVRTLARNGASKDGPIGAASTSGAVAIAASGNDLYFAEQAVLRRVRDGRFETLTGNAAEKTIRDGSAVDARFANIGAMTADDRGRIWLIDDCSVLRRRETDGSIKTLWTLPNGGCSAPSGPYGLAAGTDGSVAVVYAKPFMSLQIARIGDDGTVQSTRQLGTSNSFRFLVDGANYIVAEWTSGMVYRLRPDGSTEELAGIDVRGNRFFPAQGGDPAANFGSSSTPVVLADGSLVFAGNAGYGGSGGDLKVLVMPGQHISTLARAEGTSRDGIQGWAKVYAARLVAPAPAGGLLFLDGGAVRLRAADGSITTLAGHPTQQGDADGDASSSRFNYVVQMASDSQGNAYLVTGSRLAKVTPDGRTTTVLRAPYPLYRVLVGRDDRPIVTQGGGAFYRVAADGAMTLLTGRPVDSATTPPDWYETNNEAAAVHPDGSLWLLDYGPRGRMLRRLEADGSVRAIVAVRDIQYTAFHGQDPYQLPLGHVQNMAFAADGTLFLSSSAWTSFWRISDLPVKAP